MKASTAHIAYQHRHAHELSRLLRYQGPPPTIIRSEQTTTSTNGTASTAVRSADDQLWELQADPREGLRGIPLIGITRVPGAIKGTRPETCLDKLARLALPFEDGAAARAATGPCLPPP